jgi:hypothetical protein
MDAVLKDIEARFNTDFVNDDRDGVKAIHFTHPDLGQGLEWLDDDGTLCSEQESNMRGVDTDHLDNIRDQLKDWLTANATINVTMNGVDEFFVLTVAADADEDTIIAAIEAENLEIGGSDASEAFDLTHDVRVYRNGELYLKQFAKPNPFDNADVWNAEGKRIQSATAA